MVGWIAGLTEPIARALLSPVSDGGLAAVREGTVVVAILVGLLNLAAGATLGSAYARLVAVGRTTWSGVALVVVTGAGALFFGIDGAWDAAGVLNDRFLIFEGLGSEPPQRFRNLLLLISLEGLAIGFVASSNALLIGRAYPSWRKRGAAALLVLLIAGLAWCLLVASGL